MGKKPNPGRIPPAKRVPSRASDQSPAKLWVFSFRYWRQIEFFGLGEQDPKWFVSLLEKLAALSREPRTPFLGNFAQRDAWRYHDITWTQKNIPVKRSDLHWIDAAYLENETEYPLFQFQVSTGLGRVVGFWDESDIFNVVLLDPMHNMQPAKDFDYKVTPTSPLPSQYTSLLGDVEEAKRKRCDAAACPAFEALQCLPGKEHSHNVVILRLSDHLHARATEAIQKGKALSFEEVIEWGLVNLEAESQ
jgi:hypothetical protein